MNNPLTSEEIEILRAFYDQWVSNHDSIATTSARVGAEQVSSGLSSLKPPVLPRTEYFSLFDFCGQKVTTSNGLDGSLWNGTVRATQKGPSFSQCEG